MINLVRSEWIKLRSVRSYLWIVVSALALSIGLAVLICTTVPNRDEVRFNVAMRINLAIVGSHLAWMLLGVIGVLMVGQEYRFNTIRVTFAATPNRARVLMAKAIVVVVVSTVVAAVTVGAGALIGGSILSSRNIAIDWTLSDASRVLPGTVLVGVLYALFGMVLACIVRQPIGAILLITVYPLIVESIVGGLLPKVGKWLPFNALHQIATVIGNDRSPALSPGRGVAYFIGFLVAFGAGGVYLVRRRDA